jgi:hypothetical protein
MSNAARALARQQSRRGIDLWNSKELKTHILGLMKVFRPVLTDVEMAIAVAAIQKMTHDDANMQNPVVQVRDIDEAKSRAGWYVDRWAVDRLAELKALKIEVDGEGKVNIGVEVDPEEGKTRVQIEDGSDMRVGKLGITALKPANPWDNPT